MGKLPVDFENRMRQLLPENDFAALMASYDQKKFKGIRTNTLKCTNDFMCAHLPFPTEAVEWCPTGFYIDSDEHPGKNPAYYAGLYYVQEPTAMTSAEVLDPEPGDWVLDLCAAPGGKTTQMACKLEGKGLLVANELVANRASILASNVERMGIENVLILNDFPEHLANSFYEAFDKILVDAPCSGEGMFRKDTDVQDEWSLSRVERCAERQKKILESVDKLLKPGGILVYSTCTFSPEENEQVVEGLLATQRYITEKISLPGLSDTGVPRWGKDEAAALTDTLRVWPHHADGEGHFVARLKKISSSEMIDGNGKIKKSTFSLKKVGKKELQIYRAFESAYLKGKRFDHLVLFGEKLIALPEGADEKLLMNLRVLRAGLHLGDIKKDRFEPSHTLAMALKAEEFAQVYEVQNDDEANRYLKGEVLNSTNNQGWTLICWNGHPLGFGKTVQGMIKNHYPKGLRIKKK